MAQVKDTIIKSNGSSILKKGGGLPKPSSSLSKATPINTSKQEQFYRSYISGMLDNNRITNDGWKNIYEYELEKGLTTVEDLGRNTLTKYNIDPSLQKIKTSSELSYNNVDADLTKPDDTLKKEKSGFLNKILSSFKPSESMELEKRDRINPLGNDGYKEAINKTKTDYSNQILDKSKIVDTDPLLMALSSKNDTSFLGNQTKNFLEDYQKKNNTFKIPDKNFLNTFNNDNTASKGLDKTQLQQTNMLPSSNMHMDKPVTYKYDGKLQPILHAKVGKLNTDIGFEAVNYRDKLPNKLREKQAELEKIILANPELMNEEGIDWTNPLAVFQAGVHGFAEMIPLWTAKLDEKFAAGVSGAISYGTGAALLGAAIPLPEEGITVPAAAIKGFQSGVAIKGAEHMRDIEGGHAYIDMVDSGVPEIYADPLSKVVGYINAGIEVAQVGTLLKSVPGLKNVVKSLGKEGLENVADQLAKKGYGGAFKEYFKFLVAESGQEVLQDAVPMVATAFGKGDSIKETLTNPENIKQMANTFEQSIATFLVMGVGSLGGNIMTTKTNNARYKQVTKEMADMDKSLNKITPVAYKGFDEDTQRGLQSYSRTINAAIENNLLTGKDLDTAKSIQRKFGNILVKDSVRNADIDAMGKKADSQIYSKFRSKLDTLDITKTYVDNNIDVESEDKVDISKASKNLNEFLNIPKVQQILKDLNNVNDDTHRGKLNIIMAEFNDIYDSYFGLNKSNQTDKETTINKDTQETSNYNKGINDVIANVKLAENTKMSQLKTPELENIHNDLINKLKELNPKVDNKEVESINKDIETLSNELNNRESDTMSVTDDNLNDVDELNGSESGLRDIIISESVEDNRKLSELSTPELESWVEKLTNNSTKSKYNTEKEIISKEIQILTNELNSRGKSADSLDMQNKESNVGTEVNYEKSGEKVNSFNKSDVVEYNGERYLVDGRQDENGMQQVINLESGKSGEQTFVNPNELTKIGTMAKGKVEYDDNFKSKYEVSKNDLTQGDLKPSNEKDNQTIDDDVKTSIQADKQGQTTNISNDGAKNSQNDNEVESPGKKDTKDHVLPLKIMPNKKDGANEYPYKSANKELGKELAKFSKALASELGLEHDTNGKNKKEYASVNYKDGHIILWKPNSDVGVYISFDFSNENTEGMEYEYNSSLSLNQNMPILYRTTTKDRKYNGGHNNFYSPKGEGLSISEFAPLIEELLGLEKTSKIDEVINDEVKVETPKAEETKSTKDIGYHAGDLGKAEGLRGQGWSRDTGHFGTGVYFVGDKKQISYDNYAKRPQFEIDFSNYNLFKPINNTAAYGLHDALKFVNGYYDQVKLLDSLDDLDEDLDRYEEIMDNYDKRKVTYQKELDDMISGFVDNRILLEEDISLAEEKSKGDRKEYHGWVLQFLENNNKYSGHVGKARERYEDFKRNITTSKLDLGNFTPDRLLRIISREIAREYTGKIYMDNKSIRDDSASTRFMKKLGYEGVDVRHLRELDNTTYGSVIYDLKGNDLELANKQGIKEVETKEEVEEANPTNLEVDTKPSSSKTDFKDSKIVDKDGNLMVVYHGSNNKFDKFNIGNAKGWGDGVYFADNIKEVAEYGKEVYKAHLNIVNPYTENSNISIEDIESTDAYKFINKDTEEGAFGVDGKELFDEVGDFANKVLKELGYDGVMYKGANNIKGYEIVAFYENQIKILDKDITNADISTNEDTENVKLDTKDNKKGIELTTKDMGLKEITDKIREAIKEEAPADWKTSDNIFRQRMVKGLIAKELEDMGFEDEEIIDKSVEIYNALKAESGVVEAKTNNFTFEDIIEEVWPSITDLIDEYDVGELETQSELHYDLGILDNLSSNINQQIELRDLLSTTLDEETVDQVYNKIEQTLEAKKTTKEVETKAETKPTIKRETKVNHKSSQEIAEGVKEYLKKGEKLSFVKLFNLADTAYNGTQANNDYEVKDAYDSLELGVNQYLLEQNEIELINDSDTKVAIANSTKLESLLEKIPTQASKRTEEMISYQQFSTPPNIAYVANWVADINNKDTMLEPSAGIGGLAVFAKAKGAKVVVNELSPRRLEILKNMPFDSFHNENAEQIDNILPDNIKPTVVVMNPPFSSTAGRVSKNSTANAKLHLQQALDRLEDNGRLVAIVGYTMGEDFPTFRPWWSEMKEKYNVRANVTVDGKNYTKYGTSYDVNIIVIDKTGPTIGETLKGKYSDLGELIISLEGIKNDRNKDGVRQVQQSSVKSDSKTSIERDERGDTDGQSTSTRSNVDGDIGVGLQPSGEVGTDNIQSTKPTIQGSDDVSDKGGRSTDSKSDETIQNSTRESMASTGLVDGKKNDKRQSAGLEVNINTDKKVSDVANIDKIFSEYSPAKVKVKGSKSHKGKLAESAAMGAVTPPNPIYSPSIPSKIVTNGDLSDAQLEAIVYTGQAHEQILPNGLRRGFFIGDGTGVGKGREIAGIILDNYNQGRKKSVWISANKKLFEDAKRDIGAMGLDPDMVFGMPKTGTMIDREDGVLFVPYTTVKVKSSNSLLHNQQYTKGKDYDLDINVRLDQLVKWLGADFDGVIAFDEAHKMANALGAKGSRGSTKPSQVSLTGQMLQDKLPNARIVYVSATGASEVNSLAYLSRLGLWGDGTPFESVHQFVHSIGAGGVSAMELVARDMKGLGVYLARSLSFDDVTYERVTHELTEEQNSAYDLMAGAWQVVMQNMEKAIDSTGLSGKAAGSARSQFWGSQQRFFNQILISDSMPTTLKNIQEDIDAGQTVVIQLTSTNEAMQNRKVQDAKENDIEFEDIDMSPKDMLIQFLNNSFPVQQFEEYEDENGNKQSRPVLDSQGNPVINKEAERARDKLIMMVGSVNMPDSPIDMIINKFGAKNVAEITGRSTRLEKKISNNGTEKTILANRSDKVRDKELDDFVNDKKRILIFSQAGGTGKSYHASNDYKNNHKRVHYMLESGFNVMNAMQGLGRSHRTNQKSAPHVKLITTNVPGHKRFISTIAKRFDQLGALTRGQREAASQGLFSEKDNLEGPTASSALSKFYKGLYNDRFKNLGISGEKIIEKMGLTRYLLNEYGGLIDTAPEMTDIKKFLNRILVLEVELQQKLFEHFENILEESVEQAIERGTLDVGLENFRADSIVVDEEVVVRVDKETKAETKVVTFDVKEITEILDFKDIETESPRFKGFYMNTRSGTVRAYFISRSVTNDDGSIEKSYKSSEPDMSKTQKVKDSDLEKETMKELSFEEAEKLWNEQKKDVPEFKESQKHLITGLLLPVWDKVTSDSEKTRVMRVITDDGAEHLGLLVKDEMLDIILGKLGAKGNKKTYTPKQVFSNVLNNNQVALLDNGWKIKRSRIAGENRIEVTGPNYSSLSFVDRIGIFTEVISSKTRFFIPTNEDKGLEILSKLLESKPIARMVGSNNDNSSYIPSATAGKMPKQSTTKSNKKEIKSISEIVREMEKDFSISISSKRFRGRKGAIGTYQTHSESVRVKMDNDISTIAHEVGHHLDKKYNLADRFESYISDMEDELNLSPDYKEEQIPGEVIAEFIRLYITTEDAAQKLSQDFYDGFMETIDKEDLKNLNKHRKNVTNWLGSETRERVMSTQRSYTEKTKVEWDKKKLNMEMNLFDDIAPIRLLAELVEEKTGEKLPYAKHPYVLAMNVRRAGMIAKSQIMEAQSDIEGNIIGKSFKEVLSTINKDDMREFDAYLKITHAITLDEFNKRVFSDDFTLDQLKQAKEEFEKDYPHFKETAQNVYDWWSKFVEEWVVKAGFMDMATWNKLKANYPTYVPNMRVLEGNYGPSNKSKKGYVNQKSPIKRMKGSAKDTYSVIESFIIMTDKIVKTQKKNEVGQAIHELYKTTEGMGEVITKISPEMAVHKYNATDLKAQLSSKLVEDYVDKLSAEDKKIADKFLEVDDYQGFMEFLEKKGYAGTEIIDSTIDNVITYFTAKKTSTDSEVFTVVDKNGDTHFYETHDPLLLEALTNMENKDLGKIIAALGQAKRIMTNLTTGANPIFAVYTNLWSDIPEAYTYGNYKNPLEFGEEVAKSMKSVFTHDDKVVKYRVMGGGFSAPLSEKRQLMNEMLNSLFPDMKKESVRNVGNYVLGMVEQFNEIIETAPRLTEYNKYIKEFGDTYEGRLMAMYHANEVTVNFQRHGRINNSIGQVVPFLNAGLQGTYKLYNEFVGLKGIGKDDINKDGSRKKDYSKLRSTLTKAIFAITMFEIAQLVAYDDDDDYNNLNEYTKDSYWLIKYDDGKFLKIRKSRELGLLFGSYFRRGFRSIFKDDKQAWDGFKDGFMSTLMPPNPVTENLFSGFIQVGMNKSWSGIPIVPLRLQNRDELEQYDVSTSEISKAAAKVLAGTTGYKTSPMNIEYLLQQYTGFIGQLLLPATTKGESVGDVFERKTFTDIAYSNRLTNNFYDRKDELDRAYTTYNQTGKKSKDFNPLERYRYYQIGNDLSDMYSEIRDIKENTDLSKEEKQTKERAIRMEMLELTDPKNLTPTNYDEFKVLYNRGQDITSEYKKQYEETKIKPNYTEEEAILLNMYNIKVDGKRSELGIVNYQLGKLDKRIKEIKAANNIPEDRKKMEIDKTEKSKDKLVTDFMNYYRKTYKLDIVEYFK